MSSIPNAGVVERERAVWRLSSNNVVPLHRGGGRGHGEPAVPVHELVEAAWTFEVFENCVATLSSGGIGAEAELSPISRLQVELPKTERWLGRLSCIGVANWPDVDWALRLRSAHAVAVRRLRAVTESLYASRPGVMTPASSLVDDAKDFAAALHALRTLIIHRYPTASQAT